jgi:hypothetical protein
MPAVCGTNQHKNNIITIPTQDPLSAQRTLLVYPTASCIPNKVLHIPHGDRAMPQDAGFDHEIQDVTMLTSSNKKPYGIASTWDQLRLAVDVFVNFGDAGRTY